MAHLLHAINFWGSQIEEHSGVQVRKAQVCSLCQNLHLLFTTHLFKTKCYETERATQCPIIPPDDLLSDSWII
jgi:hypothetical protein